MLRGRTLPPAFFLAPLALPLAFAPAGPAQGNLERLETQFNHETSPVKKAKKLVKLGQAELVAIHNAIEQKNPALAASLAERYRDQVIAAHQALLSTGVNAEKHPEGFKQLQVSLRENLFKLRDLVPLLPLEQRAPFAAVDRDLASVNQQLLLELFPQSPSKRKKHRA